MEQPKLILIFSGKRKSGKDFICEQLKSTLGEDVCAILRISGPLKQLYAQKHNLDLGELMSDGPYKETFRLKMINWSDEVRKNDYGYFCRATCENGPSKPLWIVSDVRRKTDMKWFKETYNGLIKTIRVTANLETRKKRGWTFTTGIDDVESECDLDDYDSWDITVKNNDEEECNQAIETINHFIKQNM